MDTVGGRRCWYRYSDVVDDDADVVVVLWWLSCSEARNLEMVRCNLAKSPYKDQVKASTIHIPSRIGQTPYYTHIKQDRPDTILNPPSSSLSTSSQAKSPHKDQVKRTTTMHIISTTDSGDEPSQTPWYLTLQLQNSHRRGFWP